MSYNTKQKDIILKIIKDKNKEFSIKDIYNSLEGKVGLTTIYRLVDKLILEGYIKKTISNDNIAYYEYLEKCNSDNHFYLKCNSCKNLEHVDCECINELYNHINLKHNFKLDKESIIISGLCKKCVGKENIKC